MSLLNKETTASANAAPAFEAEADTATTATTKVEVKADTKVKPAATTAVATTNHSATAVAIAQSMQAMTAFKDALHVDYNTLAQVIANQGNFIDRETKVVLGDTVFFELLSYQDSYVISPGSDDAPDDLVRYSDDGVTCSDGTDVQAHLAELKKDWPKAAVKQRVVVVGAIESASKSDKLNGSLVQFDLSPASRTMWQRYLANAAYGLKLGKFTADSVKRIKATTEIKTKGNDSFTQASFDVAPA